MDGTAGGVATKLAQVERFSNNSLPGKRGITMNQQRHYRISVVSPWNVSIGTPQHVLLGPHHAFDNRIYRFQVAGIGCQADSHFGAARCFMYGLCAQMVLHITRSLHRIRINAPFEFREDDFVGFLEDVSQHVEPATVCHPNDNLLHFLISRIRQQRIDHWNHSLAAFKREAFVTDVFRVEEALEGFAGIQALQNAAFHRW